MKFNARRRRAQTEQNEINNMSARNERRWWILERSNKFYFDKLRFSTGFQIAYNKIKVNFIYGSANIN